MDLNKVMIIGRLAQEPEKKVLPSGQPVTSFSVVTNRTWVDKDGQKQEKPEFHNVVAWGKLADICEKYLQKGKKVYIEARLQTRSWDGQDGVKRYRTELIAENMIMLDNAGANNQGANNYGGQPQQSSKSVDDSVVEDEIRIEDIPF